MLKTGGTLVVAYTVLLALSVYLGDDYTRFWFPEYRWVLGWALPEFEVEDLTLAIVQGDTVVRAKLTAIHVFYLGDREVPRGTEIVCSTLAGHAVLHPLLMIPLWLAWPGFSPACRLAVPILALPGWAAIEALDIPLILAGSAWDLLLFQLAPNELPHSPMVAWMHFMNGGGRSALSLAIGMLTLVASQTILRFRLRVRERFIKFLP